MSSSTQRGLKRAKKSDSQSRKDSKKRKEEDKVLASSMNSYLFGDQETTVSKVRDYEDQDSSKK